MVQSRIIAIMVSRRLMMPLPHKKVTTFRGPTWYFDEGVFLDTIYDEDYGAFHRDGLDEYYKTSIDIRTTCLYLNDPDFDDLVTYSKRIATQIKFVLNNFAAGTPVVLPYAALIQVSGKARVLDIVDIEAVANPHAIRRQTYKLRPASDRETISNYYKVVNKCCQDHPTLLFALERFNSGLTRHEILDRIVDVTISLESLISGTQELTYRFALHNSLIAESKPEARRDAFDLLHNLYIVRSGIVHGDIASKDKEKALKAVVENWEKTLRLASSLSERAITPSKTTLFGSGKGRKHWLSDSSPTGS
jgi:hypothetical protein